MENPAAANCGAPKNDLAGASIDRESNSSSQKLQPCNRDFLLRNMRCVVFRTKLIAEEVSAVGALLRDGLISPELALAWVEDIAPGCLVVVAESVLEGARE